MVRRLLFFFFAAALTLSGCGEVSVDPPSPTGLSAEQRLERGQAALAAYVKALNDRDAAAYSKAIDERFSDALDPVLANADLVEAGPIEAEYVDTVPGALTDAEVRRFGPGAWLGSVRLRYDLGLDAGTSSHETALVLTPEGDGARVAGLGGHGLRSPLWLTSPIEVARSGDVAVINAGARSTRGYLDLARTAVRDVRATLPRWRGPLVVEVPKDKDGLDTVLAVEPDTYANIAAVTTTADGSVVASAPVHVYLNPEVFGTLKQRGSQVVFSHEATHVATDASFASMPIWLLEGFADYVALKPSGVPVEQAAGQVIKRMKKEGLPDSLPTPEDLQPTAEGLGATYEEAWLACRFLAQRWGEPTLVAFYDSVSDGRGIAAAMKSELGVNQRDFVRLWRDDLRQLVNGRMAG
ncbi:MAG: hypothetical protein EOO74_05535 [Myxococcales bacterium]|nr:MAG: hypothetical protein EOO74_05535 [Myxococcales bacterium]